MPDEQEVAIPSSEPNPNLPDDFEAPQAEASGENPAPEPEPVKEEVKTVPLHVVQEMRQERQRILQEAEQLRLQNILLSQQMQQFTQPKPAPPPQQPKMSREEQELEEILEPFIQRKIAPVMEDLRRKDQFIQNIAAEREASRAMDYVTAHVPDFQELAPDLQAWLESQAPAYRNNVTSHPDNVIMACNMIRAIKAGGNTMVGQQVAADIKARSKSERGISTSRPSTSSVDFNALSDEDFAKYDREIQNGNWKGKF